MENALTLKSVTKWFDSGPSDRFVAVDDLDLELGPTEFLAMVGPSGCGKSTLLRLIAGLEQPSKGAIFVGGERVDSLTPQARNIGFMFQGYALFKHMTVADNIGFGLMIRKVPARQRRDRIDELVALMGLESLEARRPGQLSGGQQQRVALARALAPRPRLLLLDEPFGAVDAKVRQKLRADTKRWQRELKIPTILVTHDQREALELGDRVAVMSKGRFQQIDNPWVVYQNPATEFVAQFIGRVNVFPMKIHSVSARSALDTRLNVMVRPEDIAVEAPGEARQTHDGQIEGIIMSSAFLGRTVRLEVQINRGRTVTIALPKRETEIKQLWPGRPVMLTLNTCQIFSA